MAAISISIEVRLGLHRDEVSGGHSVMMLRSCSDDGQAVIQEVKQRFQQHWPHLLRSYFNTLAVNHVVLLSQLLEYENVAIDNNDQQEIRAFAYGQRGYEFSYVALWKWLSYKVGKPEFLELNQQQQTVCVQAILQQQSWSLIANQVGLSGKNQLVTALRKAITKLLA
ncbi:MAG: tRNA-binding protein [Gammaproteobacteria bacterium]|nr:tRNA-binding protein [Gammaproteobacteria bacterium]